MLYYNLLHYTVLFCAVLHYTVLYYVILHHTIYISYSTLRHCTIYCTLPYHTIVHSTVLSHPVPSYTPWEGSGRGAVRWPQSLTKCSARWLRADAVHALCYTMCHMLYATYYIVYGLYKVPNAMYYYWLLLTSYCILVTM